MNSCKECGIEITGGAYNTPLGLFCCECWDKKDNKIKEDAFKKSLSDLSFMARVFPLL